jgi:hypothetical protein
MKTPLVITTIAVVVVLSSGCKQGLQRENKLATTLRTTDRETIAKEMEEVLTTGMMDLWYPRCVDNEFGGYLSGFD